MRRAELHRRISTARGAILRAMFELDNAPGAEHAPLGHPDLGAGRDVDALISRPRGAWRWALSTWPFVGTYARPTPGSYPGRRASVLALLGNRVSWKLVQAWAAGFRKPPAWANELMARHLEQKARHMLWIASELRKEKPAR